MSCPSWFRCRDSNPRPKERESPPITTRPGLPLHLSYLTIRLNLVVLVGNCFAVLVGTIVNVTTVNAATVNRIFRIVVIWWQLVERDFICQWKNCPKWIGAKKLFWLFSHEMKPHFLYLKIIQRIVDAIAQWIRLHLPSCGPRFKSQAQHLCFLNLYLNCDVKRQIINKKRPR